MTLVSKMARSETEHRYATHRPGYVEARHGGVVPPGGSAPGVATRSHQAPLGAAQLVCPTRPERPAPVALAQASPYSVWRPAPHADSPQRRFWSLPRLGDVVNCRFPNFLRAITGDVAPKLRPALVTGYRLFDDGRTIVRVAYGTSRFHREIGPANARRMVECPREGDFVVRALEPGAGLRDDTCFRLRIEVELPFDNHFFCSAPPQPRGAHPSRGHLAIKEGVLAQQFGRAREASRRLGSQIEGEGEHVRLVSPGLRPG